MSNSANDGANSIGGWHGHSFHSDKYSSPSSAVLQSMPNYGKFNSLPLPLARLQEVEEASRPRHTGQLGLSLRLGYR